MPLEELLVKELVNPKQGRLTEHYGFTRVQAPPVDQA